MFDKVNLAILAAHRKTEDDFARAKKLAVQMENSSNLSQIKYTTHGLDKSEPKVISSNNPRY